MADRKTAGRRRGTAGARYSGPRQRGTERASSTFSASTATDTQVLALGRRNWMLIGSGALAVLAGFGLLAAGDITLAPILLLVGYLVLIPMGLVAGSFSEDRGGEPSAAPDRSTARPPGGS